MQEKKDSLQKAMLPKRYNQATHQRLYDIGRYSPDDRCSYSLVCYAPMAAGLCLQDNDGLVDICRDGYISPGNIDVHNRVPRSKGSPGKSYKKPAQRIDKKEGDISPSFF